MTFPWSMRAPPPPPPQGPAPAQHSVWRFVEHHLPNFSLVLMIIALIGAVLYPYMVITVPSGQVGVLWKRFLGGTVTDRPPWGEGIHVIWPWDELFLYDLRLQAETLSYNAISKEGVSLTASINIRFSLKPQFIGKLHQSIGPDYMNKLVRPEIGSRMRQIIAAYSAEEVYSTKRHQVEEEILKGTEKQLRETSVDRGLCPTVMEGKEGSKAAEPKAECKSDGDTYTITLDDTIKFYATLIQGIDLPVAVVNAINRKTEQYYLVQEYTFRVEREQKESERKRIEAAGVRDFQQTVSLGISDSYLRWRGIEATLQLAQSNNSKVVIIGSGKDGLPIILGNVDAPAQPQAAAPPADGDKDKTPASTPAAPTATPSEKTPSASLTTPSEKTPASGLVTPTPAEKTTGAPAPPDTPAERGSPPPTVKTPVAEPATPPSTTTPAAKPPASSGGLSDIKDFVSRFLSKTETKGEPVAKPAETPAAETPKAK
jgi:regulator of protease activity HflC (stomatin/prohibitin superfamily)